MKNLSILVCCFCFVLISLCSLAQEKTIPLNEPDYKKPKLFQNQPDTIFLNLSILRSLFSSERGEAVNTNLSSAKPFQFQGDVLSKGNEKSKTGYSIVIRSSNFPDARFTLSKVINPDNTVSYKGRIISFKSGDLFDLQSVNGRYALIKKNFYELVNE